METYKNLKLDTDIKMCYINDEEVELTPNEYFLLLYFLTHRNVIYSREELLEKVWRNKVSLRAIDTSIVRLRKKLGEYSDNIITRRSFGYGFKE